MKTMNLSEAYRIVTIVLAALRKKTDHLYYPISSLKGYDIFQIGIAFKLQMANEYLMFVRDIDFKRPFKEKLKLVDSIRWSIMTTFAKDEEIDSFDAVSIYNPLSESIDDAFKQKLLSQETTESFGEYCMSVGAADIIYWKKVYSRIGLEYSSDAPIGNAPVSPEC